MGTDRERFEIVHHTIQFNVERAAVLMRTRKLRGRIGNGLQQRRHALFRLSRARPQPLNDA